MAYYLIKTCYGCGVTLTREKLSEAEAIQYVKDIQTFLSQVGTVIQNKVFSHLQRSQEVYFKKK